MPTLRALQLVLPMMMVPGLQWLALLGLLCRCCLGCLLGIPSYLC
jgi:hypothetical protein